MSVINETAITEIRKLMDGRASSGNSAGASGANDSRGPTMVDTPDLDKAAREGFFKPRASNFDGEGFDVANAGTIGSIYSKVYDQNMGFTLSAEEEARRFPNSGEGPNNKDRTGPPTAINHVVSKKDLTEIIKREATLRGMDVNTAISVFGAEGLNTDSYQSEIKRDGKGSEGGYEASWGVTQLYTGGGLGNEYEKQTGRELISDNTRDGAETQIRFSLDKAIEQGWSPWKGAKKVGVKSRDGLSGAKAIYNWRDDK